MNHSWYAIYLVFCKQECLKLQFLPIGIAKFALHKGYDLESHKVKESFPLTLQG